MGIFHSYTEGVHFPNLAAFGAQYQCISEALAPWIYRKYHRLQINGTFQARLSNYQSGRLFLKPLDFDEMDDNYIIKQNLIDNIEVAKLRFRKKLQFLPFWWNICTRTRPKQKALTPKPEVQFSRKIKPDITSIC